MGGRRERGREGEKEVGGRRERGREGEKEEGGRRERGRKRGEAKEKGRKCDGGWKK